MEIADESTGEIVVVRDAFNARVVVHIRGVSPESYRLVRLSRQEARRLAALLLYQAEMVGSLRVRPGEEPESGERTCA